jgi:hypothetical protein
MILNMPRRYADYQKSSHDRKDSGRKDERPNLAPLMSVLVPAGSAAGATITFTILATDGGSQVVTEAGTIYFNALTNVASCRIDITNNSGDVLTLQ